MIGVAKVEWHLGELLPGMGFIVTSKLIKIGGRLVRHARRLVFQLAEWPCPEGCFGECWTSSVGYVRCLAKGGEILTRGRWRLLGNRIPFEGSRSPWRAAMTIKTDKKGGLRPEPCLLL